VLKALIKQVVTMVFLLEVINLKEDFKELKMILKDKVGISNSKLNINLTLDFDDAYQYIIAKTKLNSSFFVKTCIYSLSKLYIQKFVI